MVTIRYFNLPQEGGIHISPKRPHKEERKRSPNPGQLRVANIDLQPQMLFGVANFDRQTIINNNVTLAKSARVFEVPVVLSTVETKSFITPDY